MKPLRGGPGSRDPGRIDWTRVTLTGLLVRTYGLRRDQIAGPGWLDRERYDIAAKLPPGTDQDRFRQMLQTLLSERFQIQSHRESHISAVYRSLVGLLAHRFSLPYRSNLGLCSALAWIQSRDS